MTTAVQKGLAASRHTVDNGVVVISKQAHTVPAVTIQIGVGAGSIYDPDALVGLSHLASRVLDRGTFTHTTDEIAEAFDERGVSLTVSANRHVLTVSCTCLSEDFEAMLELVGDIVMQPAFPPQEIDKRKGEVLNAIRQDADSPAAMAMQALFSILYPDRHPYGRPSKGTVETVNRIERHDLIAFHEARCRAGGDDGGHRRRCRAGKGYRRRRARLRLVAKADSRRDSAVAPACRSAPA